MHTDRFIKLISVGHVITWPLLIAFGLAAGLATPRDGSAAVDDSTRHIRRARPLPKLADPREQINGRAFFRYVDGVIREDAGDIRGASEQYRLALEYYPESYEIRFSFARTLFALREFRGVLEIMEGINPKDAPAYRLIGAAYRAGGSSDSARAAYLESARLDSSQAPVYSFLVAEYNERGDMDSTIWAYGHLARLNPTDFLLWYELGKMYAATGKLESARKAFDSSLAINGGIENLLARVHLGDLYQLTGHADSALSVYLSAHAIDPDNTVLNRVLAAHYLSLDSFVLALPYAKAVAEAIPDEESGLRRLAIIYYVLDSLSAADSIFSVLAAAEPSDPRPHYYLGRIAYSLEDFERARDELDIVVGLTDSVYEGYVDLGFVYRKLGQPEKEIETLVTGLEKVQGVEGTVRLMMSLGAAYEQAGRVEESVETFERLLEIAPYNAQALNYLGYMLADRGDRLEFAKGLIERAIAIEPQNAAYLDSYGWVLYRLGKWRKALTYLKQAAELDNDPTIFDHLGDAYNQVNELDLARHWWRKALEQDPENQSIRKTLDD